MRRGRVPFGSSCSRNQKAAPVAAIFFFGPSPPTHHASIGRHTAHTQHAVHLSPARRHLSIGRSTPQRVPAEQMGRSPLRPRPSSARPSFSPHLPMASTQTGIKKKKTPTPRSSDMATTKAIASLLLGSMAATAHGLSTVATKAASVEVPPTGGTRPIAAFGLETGTVSAVGCREWDGCGSSRGLCARGIEAAPLSTVEARPDPPPGPLIYTRIHSTRPTTRSR